MRLKSFHKGPQNNKAECGWGKPHSATIRPRIPHGDDDLQILPPVRGTRLFHPQIEKSSNNRTRTTETFLLPSHGPPKTLNFITSHLAAPSWVILTAASAIRTFKSTIFRVSDDIQTKRLLPDSDSKSAKGSRLQSSWHRHQLAKSLRVILRARIIVFLLKYSTDHFRVEIVAGTVDYADLVIALDRNYE